MQIYQNIDQLTFEELANNHKEMYFKDQNIRFKQYRGYNGDLEIHITDLTNAMMPGKEVTQYIFKGDIWNVLFFTFDDPVSEVLKKLYRQEVFNIEYKTYTVRGIRVFSPFVKVKKIAIPRKWNISHVWKAILAEQITSGRTELYLTDDYAFDAATNFGRGSIDLLSLAKDIIESPSGWRVRVERESRQYIKLNVACYSFDYKTLFFDKTIPA